MKLFIFSMNLFDALKLSLNGRKGPIKKATFSSDQDEFSSSYRNYETTYEDESGSDDYQRPSKNNKTGTIIVSQPSNIFRETFATNMDDVSTTIESVEPQKVTWRGCMLKEDEVELETECEEYITEGITTPDYCCELCRVGTDDPENVSLSPALKKLYAFNSKNFMRLSKAELCTKYAENYNKTIYKRAQAIGNPGKLKPLTKAMVLYHKTHHDKKSFKWALKDQATYQERILNFMRRNEVMEKQEDDEGNLIDETIRINHRNLANYNKNLKEYRETIKMVNLIEAKEDHIITTISQSISATPNHQFVNY